jgi:hypothetical protein
VPIASGGNHRHGSDDLFDTNMEETMVLGGIIRAAVSSKD